MTLENGCQSEADILCSRSFSIKIISALQGFSLKENGVSITYLAIRASLAQDLGS